jgi:hypothetical protein
MPRDLSHGRLVDVGYRAGDVVGHFASNPQAIAESVLLSGWPG